MTFVAKNKNMEALVAGRVKIQLPSFSGIEDKIVEAYQISQYALGWGVYSTAWALKDRNQSNQKWKRLENLGINPKGNLKFTEELKNDSQKSRIRTFFFSPTNSVP